MNVDVALLRKYNRAGPRYTSYPTAVHFTPDFGETDFVREIEATSQLAGAESRGLSLYFHLPFCKSLCYFCGCTTKVTRNRERIARYVQALKREIKTIAELAGCRRRVSQLHWGGGTPTYLLLDETRDLMACIRQHFILDDSAEASIEIDPRNLTAEHLPTLRELGFNRVSFGIQDLDSRVQRTINRIQPEELNRHVVDLSRRLNFDSINIDLIYGLPYQTLESFAKTLERIVSLGPDRLAIFNYAHVPWMKKHQSLIPEAALPSADTRLEIVKYVIERLQQHGYVYIGMDHFAKRGDDLALALSNGSLQRNFQGYTTHANTNLYGMGLSSISQLENVYAQNEKNESEYLRRANDGGVPTMLGCRLSDDDHLRRDIIMNLMCGNSVDKRAVEESYNIKFDHYFAASLEQLTELVNDGLVRDLDGCIEVTEPGRLVLRNIAMTFDSRLEAAQGTRYSRTI